MELAFITLENGKDYFVISTTNINDVIYYLLVNDNDIKDVVIRKEDGTDLVGLNNLDEFKKVISKFYADNKNIPEITKYLRDFNKK